MFELHVVKTQAAYLKFELLLEDVNIMMDSNFVNLSEVELLKSD